MFKINRKKVFSNLLIGFGIIIITYSLFQVNKWRFIQKELIIKEEIVSEVEVIPTPLIEEEIEENILSVDVDDYINELKRSDYEDGLITIDIPKLGVNASVLNGTTPKTLKQGPGLYESSPLHEVSNPNICIAAHRTTYGAWFENVDDLEAGEKVFLEYEDKVFQYEVVDVFIVEKNDWSITQQLDFSALTLTTCHPPYSDLQRMVVRGKLIDVVEN